MKTSYKKTSDTYPSTNEKDMIAYYIYKPKGVKTRGIVQIVHGMCEYVERYEHFISFLCENGYMVVGNDHLGHGNSVKDEDDRGFFAEKNGWRCLVKDARRLTEMILLKNQTLPYFLIGHSMGSFVTRKYMSWYTDGVDGAIIMGSSGGIPVQHTATALTQFLENSKGQRYRAENATNHVLDLMFNVKFVDENSRGSWLSSDKEKVQEFNTNPRSNFIFTVKAYQDMFHLLTDISADDWAESVPTYFPVMIMSGELDPVGDNGKGVTRVFKKLQDAGIKDLTFKLYKNARHELLNDFTFEEASNDILKWLNMHDKIRDYIT